MIQREGGRKGPSVTSSEVFFRRKLVRSVGHDVDELAGDDDDLADGLSCGVLLHVGVGLSDGFEFVFGDVGGDLELGAELAVDLHDDGLFGFDEEGFVELRPGLFAEEFGAAELAVELFGEVGGEGVEDAQEVEEEVLRDFLGGSVGVHAFHHGGDGGVELEELDVFADLLDGLVSDFGKRSSGLTVSVRGHVRGCDRDGRATDFVAQAPDFGEEAGDAFDAFHGPRFDLFEGAHEHFVETEGVGAVEFDDFVRVDDVAEGLGHLLPVFAHDEALVDELFEGLVGAEVAEVVEDFVPEAGVEKVEDGMLGAADVEVDVGVVAGPVVFRFFGYEGLFVTWVAIAEVIPAGAGPLGHGVGLATEGVAVVDPVGAVQERSAGVAGGLEVFHLGLEKGEFAFG